MEFEKIDPSSDTPKRTRRESRNLVKLEASRAIQLSPEFEKNATGVAARYGLGIDDVRGAFSARPDTLHQLFNEGSKAQKGLGENIFWGLVAAYFIPILTVIPALAFANNCYKLFNLRRTVRKQVADFSAVPKSLPAPDKDAESDEDKPKKPGSGLKMT